MEFGRFPLYFTLPKGDELKELIESAKDWALLNGIAMRSKTNYSLDSVIFAPFTLLPSLFPRSEFEKAIKIQPILNELMHQVAHDHEFLYENLKNTIEVDFFTKKLFDIYEVVRKEGFTQPISLGIIRSDIMLEPICNGIRLNPPCNAKQVEINAIASGFGWLGPASRIIHRFVLERLQRFEELKKLPENYALSGICEGILEAWKIYNNERAVIIIVVEDIPYNICDQRFHQFELNALNPNVKVIRRTLTQLAHSAKLDENKKFFVDNDEVAVVYYRSGYSPDQYPSEKEWEVRLLIEKSKAIKCPSIHYHLAGTKKIQQALAEEHVLNKFFKDEEKIDFIKNIFTGLYSIDLNKAGDKAMEMAINNPENYVLKPQREGGGNNVYGEDIPKVLTKLSQSKERTAYILMDRIRPPVQSNYIIKPGEYSIPSAEDVISELGVFGVIIGTKDKILVNKQVGHMLRTKEHSVNEGGVAAGSGSLDSPFLY